MSEHITREQSGRVVTLTIDRPPVNALSIAELEALAGACDEFAEDESVSVAILRSGVPGFFSAGFDLKSATDVPLGVNMPRDGLKRVRDAQWTVLECPVPIIVAIGGLTLGLGFMLSSLCDIIIASRSARFGFPEINFGLGGAGHARRMLPEAVLRYLMLSGRRVGPEYLAQFGAVALVVEDEQLDEEARRLAEEIAGYDPMVVRNMKLTLEQWKHLDPRLVYALEHTTSGLMRSQRQQLGLASPISDYMERFGRD
jgi:enoyl-CoA hydratase